MAGYETQQVDGATEISTTPETVPPPWALVAIPGTLLVLICLATKFIYGVIAAAFVYGAMYLLMHSTKPRCTALPQNSASHRRASKLAARPSRRTPFTA